MARVYIVDRLIKVIEAHRSKIETWRKQELKETQTRTIVIGPLLEALGWDIRDPDEVQEEYSTVDGKAVDYGLKLNKRCVLLIEAKPIDDPLTDVKATTQVVSYANNNGITWCILTNGLTWKVYRSVENCPAPEKLMYEVSIDARASEGLSIQQIAQQMWRFSREEMARGSLDALGEQTFTDGKVRKALGQIISSAPRSFLNLVRDTIGDQSITPQQIKESLARIWRALGIIAPPSSTGPPHLRGTSTEPVEVAKRAGVVQRATSSQSPYNEAHHIAQKPKEAVELYRALDRICLSLDPGSITKRYLANCISYDRAKRTFCSIHLRRAGLRVWLRLKYNRLSPPPSFARDVSNVGHWGAGDLELALSSTFAIFCEVMRHD